MPKGPKGQKRPADMNQLAEAIVDIATGEVDGSVWVVSLTPSSDTAPSSISEAALVGSPLSEVRLGHRSESDLLP